MPPLSEGLGVAMCAAGADLRAAGHRVPRCLGPFDCAFLHVGTFGSVRSLLLRCAARCRVASKRDRQTLRCRFRFLTVCAFSFSPAATYAAIRHRVRLYKPDPSAKVNVRSTVAAELRCPRRQKRSPPAYDIGPAQGLRPNTGGTAGGTARRKIGPELARVDPLYDPMHSSQSGPFPQLMQRKRPGSAERGGFEPPMDRKAHTGFRDRRALPGNVH